MSDLIATSKQERTEEFMRKSLLGEDVVNTQFHLFSARSSASGRVVEPRVLCANNVLLAKTSQYFLDLLSSDVDPSDSSLFDLTDDNEVPNDLPIDEYGYGSDSDLDEYQSTSTSEVHTGSQSKDDNELFDSGSESVSSYGFITSSEQLGVKEPLSVTKDGAESIESDETAVQETPGSKKLGKDATIRLRSLGSRHVLIKDTAFQTWYTLLNYLYTGKITVLPLSSSTPGTRSRECSTSSLDKPKCSAKSMYRLACKVGLDELRNRTFSFIRSHLTERNILKELSSSIVSKHPELLEMELDVLYSHIASPAVVASFPAFARRIGKGELPHGAEIIVGIHTRLLKKPYPVPLKLAPIPPFTAQAPSNSVEPVDVVEGAAGASHVDKPGVATATTASHPSESNEPTASGPSSAPASTVAPDMAPLNPTPMPTAAPNTAKARVPRVLLPTAIFASVPTAASLPAPASASSTGVSIFPCSATASSFGPSSAPSHFGKLAMAPPSSTGASSPAAPSFGSSSASSTGASIFASSAPAPSFGKPAAAPASASSTGASISTSSATTPLFGSSSPSPFGKPAPAPASASSTGASISAPNATTPLFGLSSAPSFGILAPAPVHTPSAAAPLFGAAAAPAFAPAFGSSSTPAAASSSTASAFGPNAAAKFAAFTAAMSDPSSLRASTSGTTLFGSGQATGEGGSQSRPTFSFGRRDDVTDNQKTSASNPFSFGNPPSNP